MTKILTQRDMWRMKVGKPCRVESSVIESIHWKPNSCTLIIRFNNKTEYQYENVSEGVAKKLFEAESVGRAFTQCVKNHYPFTKLSI